MGWSWWALGNRPAVFPVAACLAGVALGPEWGLAPLPWVLLFVAAGLGAWRRDRRAGGIALGLVAAFGLGAALAAAQADVLEPPIGQRVTLEGEVERVGERGFVLGAQRVDGQPWRGRASLSALPLPLLAVGQRVRLEARLRPLVEAANPGERNRAEWAWRRGQVVTGSFAPERLVVLGAAPAWRRWLERAHGELRTSVRRLSADGAATGLLLTLAAGERAALGEELEDVFARSGLAHVLSVSGLHVAVLAFTLYRALRWLLSRRMSGWARQIDPRAAAAPLALPVVWGYVVFTGLQAPAVRSAVMCTLVLAGALLRRRSDPLNAIAVAALGMLVVDPAAPWELSVQLSFVAVLALVLLAPQVRAAVPVAAPDPQRTSGWRLRLARAREAVVQTFSASAAVTLATAPLVLAAFQRVSLAGLVSNVVTLPLSGLLTVVAAAGAALHLASPTLAVPVLWAGVQLSRLFVALAEAFARAPGASLVLPAAGAAVGLAWWGGLGAAVFARGRWRWLALATPLALVAHLALPAVASRGLVEVTFLAVGQGDAVVVSSAGRHALIDGGGVPQGTDTGQRFVVPFLRQRRVARLDLAILSHAHPDHALGLTSTLGVVPADRLWLSAGAEEGPLLTDLLAAAGPALVERLEVGSPAFALGEARVEVLGPPKERAELEGENDRSLVLRLVHGDVRFLLTGDVEAAAEASLDPGPVTVMKAPHHGSDTSSTAELVASARPRFVVFCVGRNNRFGFPRTEVVRRYEAVGSRCYRTDLDGAVTFRSDGHDVTVETFHPPGAAQARARARRRPLRAE